MSSFFSELKRRNVFRVGIAYTVVAWVLVQIAETTFPHLNIPDWSTTLLIVFIAAGFPIALLFAWAFEITPEGLNEAGYKSPEYDTLLVRAENEADSNKRRKLLQRAEEVLLTDQPLLPLYFLVSKHLVSASVGGWRDSIMDHHLSQYLHFRQ